MEHSWKEAGRHADSSARLETRIEWDYENEMTHTLPICEWSDRVCHRMELEG